MYPGGQTADLADSALSYVLLLGGLSYEFLRRSMCRLSQDRLRMGSVGRDDLKHVFNEYR